MLSSLLAIIFMLMGHNRAAGSQARTADQAAQAQLAYIVNMFSTIAFLIFLIPALYIFGKPYIQQQWAPVLSDIGGEAKTLIGRPVAAPAAPLTSSLPAAPAASIITSDPPPAADPDVGGGVPAVAAAPQVVTIGSDVQYTVTAGDNLKKISDRYGVSIDAIVSANNLSNPDRITAGQILLIPTSIQVTVTPAPLPTATPAPVPEVASVAPVQESQPDLEPIFMRVGEYRLVGDRASATAELNAVLGQYPDNESATRILEEVQYAETLKGYWDDLDRPGWNDNVAPFNNELLYDKSQADYVRSVLAGYEFEVVEYRDVFGRSANNEIMTVRCVTRGWLYGEEFRLQAIHATERGVTKTGDTFEVTE